MAVRRSIAVAQTCPVKGDVDANLEDHLRLAGCAASEGAQLVLFPELSLTGYEIGLADRLAFSEDDRRIAPLVDLAASRGIIVIAGAPVTVGARLHVGAFIIGPDRTIGLYTKRRMGAFSEAACCDGIVPPAEATVFQPGDRDPLVHFAGQTAAIAICADVGQPTHPEQAAKRGVRTYLASMFVIPSEFEGDSAKLRGYAAEHSMVVAAANYGSATGGLAAAGRSSIWAANGDLLVRLGGAGAGVAIATEIAGGWATRVAGLGDTRQHSIGGGGGRMALINGAHSIIYSSNAEADRALLRDVLGLPNVEVGQGWLIFALPPGEVAVHPGDKNDVHELYLMTDDIRAFVDAMKKREVICSEPNDQGWGILSQMTLPGGGKLGVYQPRHARPEW